jgi:DNA-directed RNA polymerase beta subunit
MMSGKHSEQSIPISGAKPPIVYTKYSKMICDQSSMNINSGYDGEVVDILDNEYVKILTDQGKEKVYHVNEYFNSIDSTSNKYDLSVKVGDKIKKGQNIFMLNSFKGGEFCTVTPAYVAYTTLYSFEHEDGMILRQGFLKELAHPALEQIEIVLTADKKYYFDASQFEDLGPDAYDRFGLIKSGTVVHRKETLFRYYEELPQDDDYVRLSKAIIKDESPLRRVKNIEVPFFIHEGTVKRVRVFTNVEKSDNAEFINYYRKQLNSEESKIRDFSHDKRFTIENPRESSGDIQYTVVIEIEYMNLAKIADKLANEYGSKGVITRIIPDEYMLRDRDGTPMDIILSPLTVPSRKNTGQFYEIKLGLVGFRVYKMIEKYIAGDKSVKVEDITEIMNTIDRTDKYNKYSLEDWKARLEENKSLGYMRVNADPFDKYFTAPMVDRLLVLIGIPEGREKLFNPQSNRWTDVPILIGMSSFRRLHFIAEKRASATGKTDIMNVPALGYGKLRSDGQSISENIAA